MSAARPGVEPPVPESAEAVTPEWLTSCLRGADLLPGNGRVTAFSARDVGTGQVGRNVRFSLEVEGGDAGTPGSVVAKFPSDDPMSRATGALQGNYEREVRFYGELVHTLEIRTPHCVHAAVEPVTQQFVLVMEDLAPARQGDQIEGCSLDDAALALSELAALHGPRWNDATLQHVDFLMRRSTEGATVTQGMYQGVLDGFRDRYADRLTAEAIGLIEEFAPHVAAFMMGPEGPLAVTHGDYRLDNMLFGTAEGGAPLAVVDWQTPGHGHPAGDASYFLGAGLHVAERRDNEEALLRHYHEELRRRGVDDYGFDSLRQDYRRFAFGGVLMAVVASMIVGQSERGDDMFMAMASRHCAHALDLESLKLLA